MPPMELRALRVSLRTAPLCCRASSASQLGVSLTLVCTALSGRRLRRDMRRELSDVEARSLRKRSGRGAGLSPSSDSSRTRCVRQPAPCSADDMTRGVEEMDERTDSPAIRETPAEDPSPSSKLFCCACLRRWIPLVYREELYEVLRLTGPLVVSQILNYFLSFVTSIFCGHLGNAELGGFALASAVINVTTAATGSGLGLACDTLVSQTFGGKNLKRVGEILQRSILILMLFCLPCWAILINTETILLALHQDPEVASISQLYVVAFLPAVPAMFLHYLQTSYLQNQGIIWPQLYAAAAANIINLATNYFLLIELQLGVKGSAAANSIAQISICILLYAFIRWKKLHVETWGGWSTASLQEWGAFMQLAIPSTLMTCFEWWIFEIGNILAGMLGQIDLGAQHVIMELGAIAYMIPAGIQAAACVRVGNALGAGQTAKALLSSKVTLIFAGCLSGVLAIILGSTKNVIGYIFTSDEEIVQTVSHVMNVYLPLQVCDALVCVSSGIFLGAGKQKIPAVANLITYYSIGLPVGISLMFAAKLGVIGLWLGLLICVCLQATAFITVIIKLNWKQVTKEASPVHSSVSASQNQLSAALTGTYPCRNIITFGVFVDVQALARSKRKVHVVRVGMKPPIGETVQDTLSIPGPGQQPAEQSGEMQLNGRRHCAYAAIRTEETGELALVVRGTEACGGDGAWEDVPVGVLSISQLVLRRGLVVLAAVCFLAVGIIMHLAFPAEALALAWGNSTTAQELGSSTTAQEWSNFTTAQEWGNFTAPPWANFTTPS
ncbi:multidrug and toxin extrusion protein 1 [Amia ocellicauda]|uniref:multidrug and toxin extrusion protein 1 n=1 Tax=Amia ocellicauda TaxID=2972642 RepID=UPI003464AA5D